MEKNMARTVWLDVVVSEKKAVGLNPRDTDCWEQRKSLDTIKGARQASSEMLTSQDLSLHTCSGRFINDSDHCHPELEWKISSNDNCQSDVASCASGFKDVIYVLWVKNK